MINRITVSINSRRYTVVANENEAYIRSLCEYVNEKVNTVLREGNHIMGEKPLLLAALNICDEYFKILEKDNSEKPIEDIIAENKDLKAGKEEAESASKEKDKKINELNSELNISEKMLKEAEDKIKELENIIKQKENAIKKQRSEFAIREKEILDMLENKS